MLIQTGDSIGQETKIVSSHQSILPFKRGSVFTIWKLPLISLQE